MKYPVRKLFIASVLLSASVRISAQAELAFPSILAVPNVISVGQTSLVTGLINNNGNVDYPAGCVLVTISVPSAICSITGVNPGSDPVWTVFNAGSLPASLTLRNTGGPIVGLGPDYPIILNVLGTSPGGFSTINGQAILNFLQGGCTALGDLDPNNNQPQTSIRVVPALSVKLSSFDANVSGCRTLLAWTSQQEENNKEYQVEVSHDARFFATIGTIAAAGNSTVSRSYQFTDNAPSPGYNYYRLKMVDLSGKVSYSSVVTVNSRCDAKMVKIHPNPVLENYNLGVTIAGYNGTLKGELIDVSGRVIRTYTLKNGENTLSILGMAQATYMLRLTEASSGAAQSFPVIVIK
jgi:hypothetical protein